MGRHGRLTTAGGRPEVGPGSRQAIRRALLRWGAAHRRDLPWRATRDPWPILVSEVMLQQTQVGRVEGYYHRFVARFPTPRSCASASVGQVLEVWQGLGYNRRAVRLHGAAAVIVDRHGGRVPDDLAELRALPGVGPYTARAVLSLAFERDHGVVDTNVARLLARAVAGRPVARSEAQHLADGLVSGGRSWELNQTLFDVGARYCRARRPDCVPCPLRRACRWAQQGRPEPDPAKATAGASRRQPPFEGSDRQGRGRLVAALIAGPVPVSRLAEAAGWDGHDRRARVVADALVADGLAAWREDQLVLPAGRANLESWR